jgi:hypothetical protein
MGQAIGGHHCSEHAQLDDGATQLLGRFLWVLHGQDRHTFEARIKLTVGLSEPIVVSFRRGHRIIKADDFAIGQAGRRIKHGPFDANVIEEIEPALGTNGRSLIALGRCFNGAARMQMIEGRKDDAFTSSDLAIRGFHMRDNGGVVFEDMAVAVNDPRFELHRHLFDLLICRDPIPEPVNSYSYNLSSLAGSSAVAEGKVDLTRINSRDTVAIVFPKRNEILWLSVHSIYS